MIIYFPKNETFLGRYASYLAVLVGFFSFSFKAQEDTFRKKKLKTKGVKLNVFICAKNFPTLQSHITCHKEKIEMLKLLNLSIRKLGNVLLLNQ